LQSESTGACHPRKGSSEGRTTTALTFTVSGSHIYLSVGSDAKQFGGTVGPNGDFVIVIGKNEYRGKLGGKSLSGNWRLPHGWLFPDSDEMTGPFSASLRS
jgi:hypothetical protein